MRDVRNKGGCGLKKGKNKNPTYCFLMTKKFI